MPTFRNVYSEEAELIGTTQPIYLEDLRGTAFQMRLHLKMVLINAVRGGDLLLLCFFLSGVSSFAGSRIPLFPVNAFGEVLSDCSLTVFSPSEAHTNKQHVLARFGRGLVGDNIPFGEYFVRLQCGAIEVARFVEVNRSPQFELMSSIDRILNSEKKPVLIVKLNQLRPESETWWVRLASVYGNGRYTSGFERNSGEARILDPEPGRYVVSVSSSNGRSCIEQVDLVEFTSLWEIDPETCKLELDHFAHGAGVISPASSIAWRQQMNAEKKQMLDETEQAVKNNPTVSQ